MLSDYPVRLLNRRTVVLLALAISSVALSGCATITRGTHEALVIESEPSGAQVRLSNGFTGTTPTSFKISRKGDLTATISREGYETVYVNVTTQVAGAGAAGMAGNVLVGGIIGVGVDAFSGGMLEHKPNPVKVTMVVAKAVPPVPVTPAAVPVPVATTPSSPPAATAVAQSGPAEEPKPKVADKIDEAPKPVPAAVVDPAKEKKAGV